MKLVNEKEKCPECCKFSLQGRDDAEYSSTMKEEKDLVKNTTVNLEALYDGGNPYDYVWSYECVNCGAKFINEDK